VWPENWRAFELFVCLGWHKLFVPPVQPTAHSGGVPGRFIFEGLRWEQLDTFERRLEVPLDDEDVPDGRRLVQQLRQLESEAREFLNG
jgi:hypothetical protein